MAVFQEISCPALAHRLLAMRHGLGELDGLQGVVERGGNEVARIELRDDRFQEVISIPMPGGREGKKPGRIQGAISICFLENEDAELREHLRRMVNRERVSPMPFDIVLDDRERLTDCQVAGPLGGRNGVLWYLLEA
jgi:hypothetical protein